MRTTTPLAEIAELIPQSAGSSYCPRCGHLEEDLGGITPAEICVRCAVKTDPSPTVTPHSDPFWLLTPAEIERSGAELKRLHAEAQRLERTLPVGDWGEKEGPILDAIRTINRETMLLAMLREASRQFGSARGANR